jgi:hypothetical protein
MLDGTMTPITATVPLVVLLVASLCSPAFAQLARDAAIAKAEAIFKNIQDGNTADLVKTFNAQMTEALPAEKITPVWPAVVAKFGAFKSITERREGPMKGRQAVELILAMENETIVLRTVFDADGKVSGLIFQPLSMSLLPPPK